jgi:predicted TIM-barrel fold metal-dependent hydrolase
MDMQAPGTLDGFPRFADCHAHIVNPERFPFQPGPGYMPRPDEIGTADMFAAVLDSAGGGCALLVQPSSYGTDNSALLDAIAGAPGRYRGIAVVALDISDRELEKLAAGGIVGVRFNLVSYERDALDGPEAANLLERIKSLGWFAQVFAHDEQWPELAETLNKAGVKVLVDHFGVRDLAGGVAQAGFQAVLALGGQGRAAVKLSAPFRVSRPADDDLIPFAEALIANFGIGNCIWGSDWPFLNVTSPPSYEDALAALARFVPREGDRRLILWENPARLFGFGKEVRDA